MFELMTPVLLSPEQRSDISWVDTAEIAILVDPGTNRIVSAVTLDITRRGLFCDSCNYRCAMGRVVWTHEDYRSQGLVSSLHKWMREQLGVDQARLYIDPRCQLRVEEDAFLWARDLRKPPGWEWSETATSIQNVAITEAWIAHMSEVLGYDL